MRFILPDGSEKILESAADLARAIGNSDLAADTLTFDQSTKKWVPARVHPDLHGIFSSQSQNRDSRIEPRLEISQTAASEAKPAESRAEQHSEDNRPELSAPLKLFGYLLLIPIMQGFLILYLAFETGTFGFDLPTDQPLLKLLDSTLGVVSIFVAVGAGLSLVDRKSGLRKFAIAILIIMPIRYLVLYGMVSGLQDNDEVSKIAYSGIADLAISGLFVSTAMAIIWIPYFMFSKRVKEIVSTTSPTFE